MKYLVLIQSNENSRAVWETLSDEERWAFGRDHLAMTEELRASGELIVSEGLTDPALATRVSRRGGETLTTDGPFAEVKEYLAGFYLVDVDSPERAVEIAARAPDAAYNHVEIRPVFDLSVLEQ